MTRINKPHTTPASWGKPNPNHSKAISMIGYTLTLGGVSDWLGLAISLAARLKRSERVALAFAALKSLDRNDAVKTVEAALYTGAGMPPIEMCNRKDQAIYWADMADEEERAAYCWASFERLPEHRQTAFIEYVQDRRVAA